MQDSNEIDLSLYDPGTDAPFALNGRYRLDSVMGQGGMGKVFHGTDLVLNRPVVVKILLSEHVQEKAFVERFTREAEILSKINHPHLLVIYDYGVYANKTPYTVTEFVEGKTLAEIVALEGRLQVKRSLNIIGQIADALSATHAQGVIHRDLKSENILVGGPPNAEWVKVIDFGLAYQMQHRAVSEHATRITGSGLFVGTLAYMPPEQFMNENLDGRTDIYSLGILLWEMLVGYVPFTAPTLEKFYAKHSSESVPAFSSISPPLPSQALALEMAILKALAKRPKDRWKDVTEFKMALLKAEENEIRDSIPYTAYNIKTGRVPTANISYPDTQPRELEQNQAVEGQAAEKKSYKVRRREKTKYVQRTGKAMRFQFFQMLSKAVTFIFSAAIYLIILGVISFLIYVGYPKLKAILNPPPQVRMTLSRISTDGDMVTAPLNGEAEFCSKIGKLSVETTLVDSSHNLLEVKSKPPFLVKTSDGTYADIVNYTIRSDNEPFAHSAVLPLSVFLGSDAHQKFCVRVRVIGADGTLINTFYSAPQKVPSASP